MFSSKAAYKYPGGIVDMFDALREMIFISTSSKPTDTLWAKLPSYYASEAFARLIPFMEHINVEAKAILQHTQRNV